MTILLIMIIALPIILLIAALVLGTGAAVVAGTTAAVLSPLCANTVEEKKNKSELLKIILMLVVGALVYGWASH